jgi:DNA primase catalytic subunit
MQVSAGVKPAYETADDPDVPRNRDLIAYNKKAYPCKELVSFLCGGPRGEGSFSLATRELAFDVLTNDTYLDMAGMTGKHNTRRAVHVSCAESLTRVLREFPVTRINVGAVYPSVPIASVVRHPADLLPLSDRLGKMAGAYAYSRPVPFDPAYEPKRDAYAWYCSHASEPFESEIKVDIDADALGAKDGNQASRSCKCLGSKTCPLCWSIIGSMASTVDCAIEWLGGGGGRAWFYSGGRGLHMWAFCGPDYGGGGGEPRGCGPAPYQTRSCVRSWGEQERTALRSVFAPRACDVKALVDRAIQSWQDLPAELCAGAQSATLEEAIVREHVAAYFFSDRYAFGAHSAAALKALATCGITGSDVSTAARSAIAKSTEASNALERAAEANRAPPRYAQGEILLHDMRDEDEAERAAEEERAIKEVAEAESEERNVLERARRTVEDADFFGIEMASILTSACAVLLPRIDEAVTKDPKHLLKAPMSAHPKTGYVAVPIPRSRLEGFFPVDAGRYGASDTAGGTLVPRLVCSNPRAAAAAAAYSSRHIGPDPTFSSPEAFRSAVELFGKIFDER